MLVGLALAYVKPTVSGWDVLVMFGLATALPILFVIVMTVYLGDGRLREFLLYYSLKHGYHWLGVMCVLYVPLLLAGALGAYMSYLH